MTARPPLVENDIDQGPTAADSGAPTSDRSQRAARTVGPVADHRSARSVPARCCGEADPATCAPPCAREVARTIEATA